MKKILFSIFLVFCMCFNDSVVYASEVDLDHDHLVSGFDNAVKFFDWIKSAIGASFKIDVDWFQHNASFIDFLNNLEDGKYYYYDDNSCLCFTDECVDAVKDICDQYIVDCGDYKLVPTLTVNSFSDSFSSLATPYYNYCIGLINTYGMVAFHYSGTTFQVSSNSGRISYSVDFDSSYFCLRDGKEGVCVFFDGLGNQSSLEVATVRYDASTKSFGEPSYALESRYLYYDRIYADSYSMVLLSKDGRYIKVWKTRDALLRYLRGLGGDISIYTTNNYNNYNVAEDNSITINRETLNNIVNNDLSSDIGELVTNINQSLNSYYVDNGTTMSQTDIQQIIDQSVQNLINNYYVTVTPPDKPPVDPDNPNPPGEDVSGNNPGGTVSGGSISGNGADGPQTVSILSKIYSKLCEVYDFLSGAILDALKSIKNAIVANTLVDVAGGIADLISGGLDAVGGFMDDTVEAFAPVAEMLPEKFPTCIPWDLIAIFTVIVSSGSPPVYEVPVSIPRLGIDYTLTLDLSIFEPVAILCRAFLSLLMVMMLIHMTIRLTSGGDN